MNDRKMVDDRINITDMFKYELTISSVIKKLKEYEIKYPEATVDLEYDTDCRESCETDIVIKFSRVENENEFNKRLKDEQKQREKEEKLKLKNESDERKLYLKLKDIYEK